MINGNYYKVDWKKYCRWNIPRKRRGAWMLSVLYGLIYGVIVVHQSLLKYKDAKVYQLLITPQVCFLERLLNDRFDFVLRRIRIDEPVFYDPWYLYQEAELKPEHLYLESEANPVALYTEQEAGDIKDDFNVLVPAGISFDEKEMRSLIDKFRLPGKKYTIKIIQ